jgi:hypothetical protein
MELVLPALTFAFNTTYLEVVGGNLFSLAAVFGGGGGGAAVTPKTEGIAQRSG